MALKTGTIGHLHSCFARGSDPIFLLGAGASVSSGIPLAKELAEKIAIWGYRIARWGPGSGNNSFLEGPYIPRSDWLPWLGKQEWYETNKELVENYTHIVENILIPQDTRKEFFLEIINPKVPPSSGYEQMAELMARKHIRTIYTTNFDTILPDFCKANRRPHYVNIIQTEADYTKFSTDPQHPQIIYLHGSVEHYTDKNTLTEINEKLDPVLVSDLVRLLRDHPLVVIGYRGAEPSVMQHLLIDHAKESRDYHQGIFWCVRNYQKEGADSLTPYVRKLADRIPTNFQIIPIDGFDEAMNQLGEYVRDLQSNSIHLQTTENPEKSTIHSYDLQPIKESSLDDFEWSTLKTRVIQYCKKLNIPVPDTVDDNWIINELHKQNVVSVIQNEKTCPTNGGYLLFATNPQNYIQSAQVIVRAKGNPVWIEKVFGDSEADYGISTYQIERN